MKAKIFKQSASFIVSRGDLPSITPLAVSRKKSSVVPLDFPDKKELSTADLGANRLKFSGCVSPCGCAGGSVDRGFTGPIGLVGPVNYGKEVPSQVKSYSFAP